jgi:hypothetical protein
MHVMSHSHLANGVTRPHVRNLREASLLLTSSIKRLHRFSKPQYYDYNAQPSASKYKVAGL